MPADNRSVVSPPSLHDPDARARWFEVCSFPPGRVPWDSHRFLMKTLLRPTHLPPGMAADASSLWSAAHQEPACPCFRDYAEREEIPQSDCRRAS